MKTFKALHNKSYYKNTEAWVNAVYRNNKAIIDEKLSSAGSPKKVFKQMIKEYMEEGLRPTKAVATIAQSRIFRPPLPLPERMRENMMSGLVGDRSAYKAFREFTKEKGRYTKIDKSKIIWSKSENAYIYGNTLISFQNSPYGVTVKKI